MANQIKKDIKEYAETQATNYDKITSDIKKYERQLKILQDRMSEIDDTHSKYYKNLARQAREAEQTLAGANKRREAIFENLKKIGEEEVIKEKLAESSFKNTQENIDFITQQIQQTADELKILEANSDKASDEIQSKINSKKLKLDRLKNELQDEYDKQDVKDFEEKRKNSFNTEETSKSLSSKSEILYQLAGIALEKEPQSNMGKGVAEFGEMLGDKFKVLAGPIGKITNIAGKILDAVGAVRKTINGWVDEAAAVLSQNVGKINAALEGTGKTYASTTESMINSLGMNRFVKQTDYISQIAALTAKGITYNVEQRAILETIKDKTIASFDATNNNLLRLIRIRQQDLTANFFGLEAALRNTLNSVFKDSSYMYDMYDQISGAITDALVVSGKKDVTGYSSIVQTWMGAMYESGIDGGLINKLANAINNLGSGNVSALASDADIQRLILLSMDTVGMDYADILQQGLSTNDINDLLTAIVKYLTKIESNTKENNVLTSSYTNLFGMSRADLEAFKNLEKSMGSLSAVNGQSALAMTQQEINKLESTERTIVAEQIDNFISNTKFTFGNEIAKDASSYLSWKVKNLLIDVTESVAEMPGVGVIGKSLAKGVGAIAGMALFTDIFKGLVGVFQALPSAFTGENRGISQLINGAPTYGGTYLTSGAPTYGDRISTAAAYVTDGGFKTVNNMSSIRESGAYVNTVQTMQGSEWDSETEEETAEDKILAEIKKFSGALVEADAESKHLAIASYLVGMTDETLRSFASIFADEDAMADTFTGKNKTLKDNFFKYMDDTTSNSKKKEKNK